MMLPYWRYVTNLGRSLPERMLRPPALPLHQTALTSSSAPRRTRYRGPTKPRGDTDGNLIENV